MAEGRVVVFTPAEYKPPHALKQFWQAAEPVIRTHGEDLLGLDAVRAYFQELYFTKGADALDSVTVDGRPGVLRALAERAGSGRYPYRSIGEGFRLIEDTMQPVIVPLDAEAQRHLAILRQADRPPGAILRRLQPYTVSIPRAARDEWLRRGALAPAHPALGEAVLAFADDAHYRPATGLDLEGLGEREAGKNIF